MEYDDNDDDDDDDDDGQTQQAQPKPKLQPNQIRNNASCWTGFPFFSTF